MAFFLWVLFHSYQYGAQDGEFLAGYFKRALLYGQQWQKQDWALAFDARGMDGDDRPRFLSYLLSAMTAKFRLWAWNFFPPPPAMGPHWFFVLFASPLICFGWLKTFFKDSTLGRIGTGFYLISVGALYPITYFFHPGKTVLNTFIMAMLWIVSYPIKRPILVTLGLTLLALISGFLDETGWIGFGSVLIYFVLSAEPKDRKKSIQISLITGIIVSLLAYWIVVIVAPHFTRQYFGYHLNFEFAFRHGSVRDTGLFDLPRFLKSIGYLLSSSLLPLGPLGYSRSPLPTEPNPLMTTFSLFLILGFNGLTYLTYKKSELWRRAFLALSLSLIFYFTVQSKVLSFHKFFLIPYGFHYASLYSVFIAPILTAWLITSFRNSKKIVIALLLLLFVIQSTNFLWINRGWQMHGSWKVGHSIFPREHVKFNSDSRIDYKFGFIDDREGTQSPKVAYSRIRSVWLDFMRTPNQVPDFGVEPLPIKEIWAVSEMAHLHAIYLWNERKVLQPDLKWDSEKLITTKSENQ